MEPRAESGRDPMMSSSERADGSRTGHVAVAGRIAGEDLRALLERDGILIVETESFQLSDDDMSLIDRHWSDGRSKNSSYNPRTGDLDGVVGEPETVVGLGGLMARYADLEAPDTARIGESVAVQFSLTNVGERSGKETAQLYVRPRGPIADRPVKELKGFAKVALAPTETRRVRIDLDARAFAFYDAVTRRWTVEPGAYDILVGASASDIELQATVRLETGG